MAEAVQLRNKVRAGDLVHVKSLIKQGADYSAAGNTLRKWTPLHIAAWGSSKPQYDREIVEAILAAAGKEGKDQAVRQAKDAVDGKTPTDLAKEKRESLSFADETKQQEEKRKFDKVCRMPCRRAARLPQAPSPRARAYAPTRGVRRARRSSNGSRRACPRDY